MLFGCPAARYIGALTTGINKLEAGVGFKPTYAVLQDRRIRYSATQPKTFAWPQAATEPGYEKASPFNPHINNMQIKVNGAAFFGYDAGQSACLSQAEGIHNWRHLSA